MAAFEVLLPEISRKPPCFFAGSLTLKPPALYKPLVLTQQPPSQTNKCLGNKWNTLISAKVHSLNMILAGLLRRTHERTTATEPSPQRPVRRPHAVRVIGAFSPLWCTTAVSGSVHSTRLLNYPERARQRSRTVRHNRAAQAEITTPYPGPRFPRAATVAHCRTSSAGREREAERGRSSAEEIQPEQRDRATLSAPG